MLCHQVACFLEHSLLVIQGVSARNSQRRWQAMRLNWCHVTRLLPSSNTASLPFKEFLRVIHNDTGRQWGWIDAKSPGCLLPSSTTASLSPNKFLRIADWKKNSHWLSEKLVPLGILRAWLRRGLTALKPPNTIVLLPMRAHDWPPWLSGDAILVHRMVVFYLHQALDKEV